MLKFIKQLLSQMNGFNRNRRNKDYEKLEEAYEFAIQEVQFFKEAINSLPNPIFIKNERTQFIFFNSAYEKFFNMKCKNFYGKMVYDLDYLPMEDRLKYQEEDTRMIRESSQVHYEVPFASSEGKIRESLYWSRGFYVAETDQRGLIGEVVDITIEKELQRSLQKSMEQLMNANKTIAEYAKKDSLTGLLNRSVLKEEVPALIRRATQQGCNVSILIADLDHFKIINDTYGHLCGDEILMNFALVLKSHCRQGDLQIRYGGEEFLIILPFTSGIQARCIAERICKTSNAILYKEDTGHLGENNYLTVSIA